MRYSAVYERGIQYYMSEVISSICEWYSVVYVRYSVVYERYSVVYERYSVVYVRGIQ